MRSGIFAARIYLSFPHPTLGMSWHTLPEPHSLPVPLLLSLYHTHPRTEPTSSNSQERKESKSTAGGRRHSCVFTFPFFGKLSPFHGPGEAILVQSGIQNIQGLAFSFPPLFYVTFPSTLRTESPLAHTTCHEEGCILSILWLSRQAQEGRDSSIVSQLTKVAVLGPEFKLSLTPPQGSYPSDLAACPVLTLPGHTSSSISSPPSPGSLLGLLQLSPVVRPM